MIRNLFSGIAALVCAMGISADAFAAESIRIGSVLSVTAVKKAGSTDKEKVRTAIEQTRNYIGVSGIVNMTPMDHMGLDLSSFKMLEIRNGDFEFVK